MTMCHIWFRLLSFIVFVLWGGPLLWSPVIHASQNSLYIYICVRISYTFYSFSQQMRAILFVLACLECFHEPCFHGSSQACLCHLVSDLLYARVQCTCTCHYLWVLCWLRSFATSSWAFSSMRSPSASQHGRLLSSSPLCSVFSHPRRLFDAFLHS